ncbi:type II toxin-antitoxin system RelE/ParE family toxin [Candidatus Pantoea formicae]|jgi:toxin ParE1/3/4|uniref:type II toxin-antitoxin system RelE/ParE family toxin n=1 Tax=Candidatus Pantoea formicae TaxID=2608355 RepID=UPI003ED8BF9E
MKRTITITQDAEQDIEELWIYGYWKFGREAAEHYSHQLYSMFHKLAEHPIGRKRADLAQALNSFPCGQHIIFYRIAGDELIIVRVLHHSREVEHPFGTRFF